MSTINGKPVCDGKENCSHAITRIDRKGFIYCEEHRPTMRTSRKLRPAELKKIYLAQPIAKY